MKYAAFASTALMTLIAAPALAHPGHIAQAAGHSHIDLGIAALAIIAALVGVLTLRRARK